MKKESLLNETILADTLRGEILKVSENVVAEKLRDEILKNSENFVIKPSGKFTFDTVEYISKQEKPYISPIMSMNEDEILDYVENHEVNELKNLTDTELNRISEVLGISAEALVQEAE